MAQEMRMIAASAFISEWRKAFVGWIFAEAQAFVTPDIPSNLL
jgi:hypothetical protein